MENMLLVGKLLGLPPRWSGTLARTKAKIPTAVLRQIIRLILALLWHVDFDGKHAEKDGVTRLNL